MGMRQAQGRALVRDEESSGDSAAATLRRWVVRFLLWVSNHVVSRVVFSAPRLWWYRRVLGFRLAPGASILTDVRFSARHGLVMGPGAVINNGCRIDNRGGVEIGAAASLSYGCHVFTKGHVLDSPDFATSVRPVVIGPRAWLCALTTVVPGVRMGEGSVALTSAVVTRDVGAFEVVGGNPAKVLRNRSRDLDYTLDYKPWVPFFG